MFNIKTTIKSILVILAILIVLATLSVFFYIMLSSYNVMTDPQFANGVVRDDIMWDDVYCEKHECKLEYITDRTKKHLLALSGLGLQTILVKCQV